MTGSPHARLVPALILASLALSATAHAGPGDKLKGLLGAARNAADAAGPADLRLSDGFDPHPTTTDLIEVEVDTKAHMGDRGWQKCGTSFTTEAPAYTFQVEKPIRDLNVVFTDRTGQAFTNAVVALSNGAFACSKGGNVYFDEAPAGRYEVYFFSSSQSAAATIRFEQPDRLAGQVSDALAAAPTVDFGEQAATNPRFVELPVTPSAHGRIVDSPCAEPLDLIRPLGKVEVETEGTYLLKAAGRSLLVASDDGCVIDEATRQDNTIFNDQYQLSPGTYELWTRAVADEAPVVLEADDLSKPLAFGEAETVALGALDEPRLLSGETRATEAWPSRRNACSGNRGAARAPDFYLHSDEPVPNVALSLYRNHDNLRFRLYGPIEDAVPYQRMICDEDEQGFRTFEGTFAVWVTDEPGAGPGTSYDILALRTDVEVDPLKTLHPIPDAPTVPERAVRDHYPFYGDMSYGYLFLHAPDQLFVQATEAFSSNGQDVAAGEPLLVVGATADKASLARFDGRRVSAPLSSLGDVTAPAVLPTEAPFVPAETYDEAAAYATPDDGPIRDRFNAVWDTYYACVGDWMARNDPTWGKSYEIIHADGETTTDKKFAEADKACNRARVDRAEDTFIREINAAASARAADHLAAVRERFGN